MRHIVTEGDAAQLVMFGVGGGGGRLGGQQLSDMKLPKKMRTLE